MIGPKLEELFYNKYNVTSIIIKNRGNYYLMEKHYKFILLVLAPSIILFGCNKSIPDPIDKPEPEVMVDSTTLKPVINISYEILEDGWVQFYNNSTFYETASFSTFWGVTSSKRVKNPKIWFPNGIQNIVFGAETKYGVGVDTTFTLNITNSVSQVDTKRFVKGVVFGDSINIEYDAYFQNSFLDNTFYGMSAPLANIPKIVISDSNESPGWDIASMRASYKVGEVPLQKWFIDSLDNGNKVLRRPIDKGWFLFFRHITENRDEISHSSMGQDESLEILDVQEVYQPPVFPGMKTTAFIVTFHYKGKLWGQHSQTSSHVYEKIPGRDLVDLTFNVKFCEFPKWAL